MAVAPLGYPLGLGDSAAGRETPETGLSPQHQASIGWLCLSQDLVRALDRGRKPGLCKCQFFP